MGHSENLITSDPYQDAEQIGCELQNAGFSEQAKQIRGALLEGATGTEIYMILRRRLAKVEETFSIPAELKSRIARLYSYLDHVLASQWAGIGQALFGDHH